MLESDIVGRPLYLLWPIYSLFIPHELNCLTASGQEVSDGLRSMVAHLRAT